MAQTYKKKTTTKVTKAKPAGKPEAATPVSGESWASLSAELKGLEQKAKDGYFKGLVDQIESEYQLAYVAMKPKWDEWALRLKLYNNQKRDKEAVGDPLIFTIMQTVLASLYIDQLGVQFDARESGDEETVEGVNSLAEFDYAEMEKDILDYQWDWDTCFFGTGLLEFCEFDREQKVPVAEVMDPMTVLRDPKGKSVNGDMKGRGRCRFLGRESRLTKYELEDAGVYFNLKGLKPDEKELKSLLDANADLRAEAQGFQSTGLHDGLVGDNQTYHVLMWYTRWKGKLCRVALANGRKQIIRYEELKGNKIPVIDRRIFPIAHDFDGVSIPDLVEDKQRARASAMNISLKSIKSTLNPMYLYDQNKITNRNDLNFGFNKFIPVNGNPTGAVQVMQREQVKQEVNWIMELLDAGAQRATATPQQRQGIVADDSRTATEVNEIASQSDTRYSLTARIWGWSEKRFWQWWYQLYKQYFKEDIDEKIVRITGALGAQYKPLRRENIIAKTDPDVSIESKAVSDSRRFNELQLFKGYVTVIAQDPNANLRYAEKHMGKLSGLKRDVLERLMPPTVDEMIAEEENKLLEAEGGGIVPVRKDDDHEIHIEIHNKASDTPKKIAHIYAHKKAMMLRKTNPELFPQLPSAQNPTGGAGVETKTQNLVGDRVRTAE